MQVLHQALTDHRQLTWLHIQLYNVDFSLLLFDLALYKSGIVTDQKDFDINVEVV